MRTRIWGGAALCLLMAAASCTKETVEKGEAGSNGLNFKTIVGKQTKAAEFNYFSDGAQIPIIAYKVANSTPAIDDYLQYDESNYIWNTGSGSTYFYDGVPMTLYSWYPETNILNPATSYTEASFEYQVAADPDDQEDLIVAATTIDNPYVMIGFEHALSQVNFAIIGPESVKARISNIKVNDVSDYGKLTMTPDTKAWSDLDAKDASYDYTPVDGTNITDGYPAIKYMGNGGGDYSYDNALMLIPQSFASAADGSFTFKIELFDPSADFENDTPVPYYDKDFTANFSDFSPSSWIPGKRYVYTVDLSHMIETGNIDFQVYIYEWQDASDDFAEEGYVDDYVASTVRITSINGLQAAFESHLADNTATPKLNKFPIINTQDITNGICFVGEPDKDYLEKFDSGDQLIITFPSVDAANCFSIGNAFGFWWSRSAEDSNPVVLTKRDRSEFYQAADGAELLTVIETCNTDKAADPDLDIFSVLYTEQVDTKITIDQIAALVRNGNVLTDNLYNPYDAIAIYFEQNTDMTDLIELAGDAMISWDLAIFDNLVYLMKRNLALPDSGYLADHPVSTAQLPYLNDINYSIIECPDIDTWFIVFSNLLDTPKEMSLDENLYWDLSGLPHNGMVVLIFPDNASTLNLSLATDVPEDQYILKRVNDTTLVLVKTGF